ncbi:ankyrin repeat protein [Legionella massiliensis]|uniref:Ankyrin repeat protein n=1 Tax=Legionella massiliensis TaxID=1034943 RepID=A0A078L2P8_9GAMM|nr:ankyrin repeat domain-containing protein [Legionella massiliensis]CDZ79492.1 ankyrin repeat protein [Legionella massiliensis]CEE15230.1 Ankyrin repeats (3 copies) [Legionella massiliensis]
MPKKHALEESSSSNVKRPRTNPGISDSVSTAFSSPSSSSAVLSDDGETVNWSELINRHLLGMNLSDTGKEGKDYYQHCIEELFSRSPVQEMNRLCFQLFSADRIGEVSFEEPQQEQLLQFLVEVLQDTVPEKKYLGRPSILATLIHHRLPETLADALYTYATNHETSFSRLQWALICRQPIREEMAAEINIISYTPPLHLAACFDNPSLIAQLKELGADMNLRKPNGVTACLLSAYYGFSITTQQLITLGADPTLGSENGSTPLLAAINKSNDDIETVKVLLRAGANVNQADPRGITPLFVAAAKGHDKVVEQLLQAVGIDVNQAPQSGFTPLHIAAQNGHDKVVEQLLQAVGIDVNQANQRGFTPLCSAVFYGHVRVVEQLLQARGIVVDEASPYKYSPFYAAADKGHVKIVELLLQAEDIDINQEIHGEKDLLSVAVRNKHIAVIKVLIAHGADKMHSLKHAVSIKNVAVIDAFFESGFYLPKISPVGLQSELSRRAAENITYRNNSLKGLALSVYEKSCWDNQVQPDARSVGEECPSRMPLGYTPTRRYFVPDALKGNPVALAYFAAYYVKNPQALKTWFKSAGKTFGIFNLALTLVTARFAQMSDFALRLSSEKRRALWLCHKDQLKFLYNEFPYESIMEWLKVLRDAPEMVNFREPVFFLKSVIQKKHIEEQGRILSALRIEVRTQGPQFFKPDDPSENRASGSNGPHMDSPISSSR